MLLRSTKGFSLIELTISLGITGLVLAGTMAISTSINKQEEYLNLSDDLNELSSFIELATARAGSCGLKTDSDPALNEFSNQNLPNAPTTTFNIPVDFYRVRSSADPVTGLTSLKQRYSNSRKFRINNIELVFPEVIGSFPDGNRIERGMIVVHIDKRVGSGDFEPIPPLKIDTMLGLMVSGSVAKIADCSSTRDLFPPKPPEFSTNSGGLNNSGMIRTPLGVHNVCIISERSLRTGQTETGPWFNKSFKDMAQKANFHCAVDGPNEAGEWFKEHNAEVKSGRGGTFACEAFCM